MITTDKEAGGPFRSIAMNSVGYFGQTIYRVQSYFNLDGENKSLRMQNTNLAYKNMQAQDALLENIRLRKLLGFREKSQLQLTAAEVIGQNPHDIVNGLLLNAGSEGGIQKSAAVIFVASDLLLTISTLVVTLLFFSSTKIATFSP